jgi:hypothetical protein
VRSPPSRECHASDVVIQVCQFCASLVGRLRVAVYGEFPPRDEAGNQQSVGHFAGLDEVDNEISFVS